MSQPTSEKHKCEFCGAETVGRLRRCCRKAWLADVAALWRMPPDEVARGLEEELERMRVRGDDPPEPTVLYKGVVGLGRPR